MAKKNNGFDVSVLEKYADQLQEAGGDKAIKWAVGDALRAAKMELNKQITKRMQKPNLPAGGKYSTGKTLEHLDTTYRETWEGNIASIPLGFDESGEGAVVIFLRYGTPKMRPVSGLNDTLKGRVARKKIREAQEQAMQQILQTLQAKGG